MTFPGPDGQSWELYQFDSDGIGARPSAPRTPSPIMDAIIGVIAAVTVHIVCRPEDVGIVEGALAQVEKPDLVTLDVHMSDGVPDGEIVYWLTSTFTGETLPISDGTG